MLSFFFVWALACGAALFAFSESSQERGAERTSTAPTVSVSLEPCEVPGTTKEMKEKARCGMYEVFENRAARSRRKIALKIVARAQD
jgi:hypothetical protein